MIIRSMMKWLGRGQPELHQRGKWWVVRWYDPISKRCRALRTRSESYARAMHDHLETDART